MNKPFQKNTEQFKALTTDRITAIPVFDKELELDVLANIAFNLKLQHKINILTEDDFYSLANKEIYKSFNEMFSKKNIIDISSTGKRILCVPLVNRQYITLPSQFDLQIEKLKETTAKRTLQDIAYKTTIMIKEGKGIDEVKTFYDSEIRKIDLSSDNEITTEDIDSELEKYLMQKELPVVKTGFPKLDKMTGGFMGGTYTIIASAQGIGKTTFMINLLVYICGKLDKKVLYVPLEMSFMSLQAKIISNISGIAFSKMMFGMAGLDIDEWTKIHNARAKASKFRICRLGQQEVSTNDIRDKLKEINDIDIVMVDYMQLLKPISGGRTLYETTTNISRELKILAGEFNIPFVVIASINRDYSDRRDFTPHISDIRGSGSIEYDADLVLLLHRESAFRDWGEKKDGDEFEFKHSAELIIAKSRFGESNLKIDMYFDGAKSLIKETAKEEVIYGRENKERKDVY